MIEPPFLYDISSKISEISDGWLTGTETGCDDSIESGKVKKKLNYEIIKMCNFN